MDIFRDAWIPTDAGVLSPAAALARAQRPAWPRADWNAATRLFLHALVQTAVVLNGRCHRTSDWARLLDRAPDDLPEWWSGLDAGSMPWQCTSASNPNPVASILPETPGENALKKSSDILRWQQHAPQSLSVEEAQIAIISDQFWGIPGGRGYREGCRGRRPLTTLLEPAEQGKSLWEQIWLNVFDLDTWTQFYQSSVPFEFPWNKPLTAQPITPQNAHTLEMLWQMPRRWRLEVDPSGRVSTLYSEGNGRNYDGWIHPLSGYFLTAENKWVETKANPYIGFRDWAAIAIGLDGKTRTPQNVNRYVQMRSARGKPLRLRCFGWALGDADAVGAWVEQVVPFYEEVDHASVQQAIVAAELVKKNLAGRLKGIAGHLAGSASRLYAVQEAEFFRRVSSSDWEGWEPSLKRAARDLYWETAMLHRYDMVKAAKAVATL